MSLYELETMWRNLAPPKVKEPTDEEWEEGMELMTAAIAGMKDVVI